MKFTLYKNWGTSVPLLISILLPLTSCESLNAPGTSTAALPVPTTVAVKAKKGELCAAIAKQASIDKISQILAGGADIDENIGSLQNPITPLIITISNQDVATANYLLTNQARTNYLYQGYSLVTLAAAQGMDINFINRLNKGKLGSSSLWTDKFSKVTEH